MPRGFRQVALSISFLSPIVRRPDAFAVTKIASLILRPERRFLTLTSFQSLRRPSLSFGSSSLISLRRHSLSLSRTRLRPPGNIHRPSRFRLTRSTRPAFRSHQFRGFRHSPYADVTQTTSNLCAQARRACCVGDHAECAEQGAGPCAWCKTMGHCSVLGC